MDNQITGMTQNDRKSWMALLGGADLADLESARKQISGINWTYIVKPETGMLMVQARSDGSNARFNLGEVTVSRCVLEVNQKYMGVGWIMGSNLVHAELAAFFDGLLQDTQYHPMIKDTLLSVLEEKQTARHEQMIKEAADTRVEFFTLKRGE
jgi:alpha-D-ribose 1-methylphosphonate 5-triphosphate synthase subunit PhnG